jgi:hypothetical protein
MSKAELYILTIVVLIAEAMIGYAVTGDILFGIVFAIMCGGIPCGLAIASA